MDIYRVAGLGFALVMVGIGALTMIMLVLRAFSRPSQQPQDGAGELDPVLIAVLTAAASEALSRPVRLYAVQLSLPEAAENWSRAGRMDVMISHRLEQKR